MTANLRYWRSVVRLAEAALDAATCLSELKVGWLWSWRSILRLWSNMRSAPEERSSEIVKRLPAGTVQHGRGRHLARHHGRDGPDEASRGDAITVDNWAGAQTQPAAYRATGDFHTKLTLAQQAQFKTETERKLKRFGARAVILAMDSVEAAEEVADGSMDTFGAEAELVRCLARGAAEQLDRQLAHAPAQPRLQFLVSHRSSPKAE